MNFNSLTIKELLNLPAFEQAKLISGDKGLDRVIRYVDIIEVPDIKGWLKEGALVLTTGYSMRHDPSLLPELIESLAQAGAAGVAIKPERFIPDIPQEMIRKSNLLDIPIIQLPIHMAYIDITYPVMEHIIDNQAALLRRSEEIHKTLTNLVLNNSGIQAVADNVSALLKSPIWIVGKQDDMLVSSPSQTPYEPSVINRQWEITVDKQFRGKFIVGKEQLDDLELVCIEQARLVFSLELMRKKIAEDTELRLRGDFFEELLMSLPLSKQEAADKGRQLGLDPDCSWEICFIEGGSLPSESESRFTSALNQWIQEESHKRKLRSFVHGQGERFVLFLASKTDTPKKNYDPDNSVSTWREAIDSFLAHWADISSGLGTRCSLWEVHRSYIEAKKAVTIGSRLNKGQSLFTFEELEIFHLMLESSLYVNFDTLIDKKIGKLSEYDKENGTDLVMTLYHYLSTAGSLIETANLMFIHRNSVKYRMDRIKEIAKIDMGNAVNRFEFYLCTVFYLLKQAN